MEQRYGKQKKASIILASLILHGIILLVALNDFKIPFIPQRTPQPILHKKDWAERNPGSSRFGAPVVFRSTPAAPKQTQQKETKRSTKKKRPLKHSKGPIQKVVEKESSANKPQESEKAIQRVTPQNSSSPTTLTMVQLLQGYLEQKGTGSDTGLRHKGTKKQPPDEQIKYERYAQKIHWCIQNAFNISKRTLSLPHSVRGVMHLHIEFKDNGTVQSVQLTQSSGSAVLDQFMLDLVHYAGSSFPPIPSALDKALLPHSYSIAIDVPATTGSNMHMSL